MSHEQVSSVNVETTFTPTLRGRDPKLFHHKIANLSTLVTNLNEALEDLETLEAPKLDEQFDFYEEVERFQIYLIKSALRVTKGSQVKAAKLLKLKATTLNAKMKLYNLTAK
jgi:transcriptional regulator with PAS, ATPase and Fis domain